MPVLKRQQHSQYGHPAPAVRLCGLQISELVGIELDDINLEEGIIKIRKAKGSKERYVPVGNIAQRFLWKYINTSRTKPIAPHITSLLLNDKGLSLTGNGVQQILRRYSKKAGITGTRCSPHTCRHTFAKNYLMNGGCIGLLNSDFRLNQALHQAIYRPFLLV